jgi:hypothetical protein
MGMCHEQPRDVIALDKLIIRPLVSHRPIAFRARWRQVMNNENRFPAVAYDLLKIIL